MIEFITGSVAYATACFRRKVSIQNPWDRKFPKSPNGTKYAVYDGSNAP